MSSDNGSYSLLFHQCFIAIQITSSFFIMLDCLCLLLIKLLHLQRNSQKAFNKRKNPLSHIVGLSLSASDTISHLDLPKISNPLWSKAFSLLLFGPGLNFIFDCFKVAYSFERLLNGEGMVWRWGVFIELIIKAALILMEFISKPRLLRHIILKIKWIIAALVSIILLFAGLEVYNNIM